MGGGKDSLDYTIRPSGPNKRNYLFCYTIVIVYFEIVPKRQKYIKTSDGLCIHFIELGSPLVQKPNLLYHISP